MSLRGVSLVISSIITLGLAVFDANNMASMPDISEGQTSYNEYGFPQEISMLNARPLLEKIRGLNPESIVEDMETGDDQEHVRFRRRAKGRKGKKTKRTKHSRKAADDDTATDLPKTTKNIYENMDLPKDLYMTHLRPGVIFRIHMSEAIIKMQYRNYAEDKDESVIDADVEYLRLTRKVIVDEMTKFEDFLWLTDWFTNRAINMKEHTCNVKYFSTGIPPTMWTESEEYMKRLCIMDGVYIDGLPYVPGDDGSLMAAVAPPVLHCDAATCTSVPFIDSLMFDHNLPITVYRTVSQCQQQCSSRCMNNANCLERCTDICLTE